MLKRFITTLSLMSMLFCTNPVMADLSLPDLQGPSDAVLSTQQQYELGRAWLRQLRGQAPVVSDPLIQSWAEHLTWQLLAHGNLNDPRLDLVIINSTDINAFAVPGGVVGLNTGTILNANTPDEVAAVMSHELAHVGQNHFLRRYTDSKQMNRAFLLALLASIAVAVAGHADLGLAGMATTQAASIQSQLAYSRTQEAEADRIGMNILVDAGYNPNAMPDFFEQLLRTQHYRSDPPSFVLSHPVTESRIADTQARAKKFAVPEPKTPDLMLDFLLVKTRVRQAYFQDNKAAESYYLRLYQKGSTDEQIANGYGLALSLMRNKKHDEALALLNQLNQQRPDRLWLTIAKAEAYDYANQHEKASQLYDEILQLYPDNYATSVFYVRNLLKQGNTDKPELIIKRLTEQRPEDPLIWQLGATVYAAQKAKAKTHLYQAEYLFLTGQGKKAEQQLEFGLKESKDNFSLNSHIKARLVEMQKARNQKF